MTHPFELTALQLQDRLDEMVEVTFGDLQSQFLTLPRGAGFIDYADFQTAYEVLKREGISHICPLCDGHGSTYSKTSKPRLALVLWVLHPRKGASRGVTVKNVAEEDLPEIYVFLRKAAEKNAEAFAKILVP